MVCVRGVINADSIEVLRTSAYFTANTHIFNEAKFEELEQTDPRDDADEKSYQKQIKGRAFTAAVIEALKAHESDKEYDDFFKFVVVLKKTLAGIDGLSDSRLNGIAMELSVIDKTAVVQKDKKGRVIIDPTTKDTEIIRLNQDEKTYMETEVYPHIPDAIYFYDFDETKAESATNKERLGAEFPFIRYFREYHEPTDTDTLLTRFLEANALVQGDSIAALDAFRGTTEKLQDSGIQWVGEIPISWNTKKIKYMATLKGRIGWQGLTSEEYQDEGAYLITGVDFDNGSIDWENCVHVPMKRWEEAKDIQIQEGDLLITKDGTIGKVAIVSNMPGEASLNSGVLRIMPTDEYSKRFLYWVLKSEEFWNWFNYKNAGNSTIQHLYQGDFAEFVYAFPKYAEQEAIATHLEKCCSELDVAIQNYERQIETLKEYKKALIFEYVTGKKRVKEE